MIQRKPQELEKGKYYSDIQFLKSPFFTALKYISVEDNEYIFEYIKGDNPYEQDEDGNVRFADIEEDDYFYELTDEEVNSLDL